MTLLKVPSALSGPLLYRFRKAPMYLLMTYARNACREKMTSVGDGRGMFAHIVGVWEGVDQSEKIFLVEKTVQSLNDAEP